MAATDMVPALPDRGPVAVAEPPIDGHDPQLEPTASPGERRANRLPFVAIALIALAGIASYAAVYPHFLKPDRYPVVRSDGAGYYAYLPAYLLHHDPTFQTSVARDLQGDTEYASGFLRIDRTGNYLQRYPVGEAVMVAPFFVAGHLLAHALGERPDGYSTVEQRASGLAALFYMILGLLLLTLTLRRYFSSLVVTVTVITIVFGTNLFHYSTFDSMFSHAFSFFLIAALVEVTHRWYGPSRTWRHTVLLGVVTGMILLVRQSNVMLVLFVPLFGIVNWTDMRLRLSNLWERRRELAVIAGVAALVFAPQLAIWHEATGKWLINAYEGSGVSFRFDHPEIIKTLFSFNPHGLLPWSPIFVLAIAGFVPLWRHLRGLFVAVVALAALNLYVIASWSNWYYGGGYGHRGFIDSLPMTAIPLASLYASIRSVLSRTIVTTVASACCVLVTVQMIHYWQLKVPFGGASWSQYVHLLTTRL
jgi:hypothetical protein